MKTKILIINGPNLNMLGMREPEKYGSLTLSDINAKIKKHAAGLDAETEFFQSNIEGEIITAIQKTDAGVIVINAGGYTHTSVAIRDALSGKNIPAIEVHMTNIAAREEFRHTSMLTGVCKGCIMGFGEDSYMLAVSQAVRIK